MCTKISLKEGQLFKLLISTDIAMQRCILGNIFDNHFI